MKRYLVTGGAGFIGSNFIHYLLRKEPDAIIINLDKLTYAGNLENLKDISGGSRYQFIRGDICDPEVVHQVLRTGLDVIVNFAAESHVDRSIGSPDDFIKTDIYGAFVLLEGAKKFGIRKFIQISTDEIYGSVETGSSVETDALMPRNPYSASKAGADRLAYSYFATYRLPVIITRASNNYGPYQYPEKLIPLFVTNALENQPLPIYGDGMNVRDWLYVEDHCEAICLVIEKGTEGEVYNIGGGNERTNLEITEMILRSLKKPDTLKTYVPDRMGHDRRYSLSTQKIQQLGWKPQHSFEQAMETTIRWYEQNPWWWKKIKTGEYLEYYKKNYRSLGGDSK